MKRQSRVARRILVSSLVLGLTVLVFGGYMTYAQAQSAIKSVAKSGSIVNILTPEALNGESTGVVNILITGNSSDDMGHDGAGLTDSIVVAHYNLSSKQLSLISIPRDLYVSVNGSFMKINAAYTVGGMDTLKAIVQQVTGLTINHEVLINYRAFKDVVDAVGGIDVTIAADDPRGINDPMIGFSIANGAQHLDGTQALLLARCRNDPTYDGREAYGLPNGDFDRTSNQRMIMQSVLTKVKSSQTLASVSTLKKLITGLSSDVTSDLTVGQLRRVYDLSTQISTTNSVTARGADSQVLLADYASASVGSALIPTDGIDDYSQIQAYIASVIAQ